MQQGGEKKGEIKDVSEAEKLRCDAEPHTAPEPVLPVSLG